MVALGGLVLPDSPVSYVERGHMEKAHKVLVRIRGVDNVDEEFQDIIDAARAANQIKHPWRNVFKSQYRPQLYISLLFMLFQQFTGSECPPPPACCHEPALFSSKLSCCMHVFLGKEPASKMTGVPASACTSQPRAVQSRH